MKRVAAATVIFSAVALLSRAQPAATVHGRVVADDTGDPLPNARVSFTPPSIGTPVVLSDDEGRFTLTAAPGRHAVVASKSGYARREVIARDGGQVVEIRLLRGSAVTGRVVDTPQSARTEPTKTYYPAAATPADAQELRLRPGDEQAGIDFVVPADPIFVPIIVRRPPGTVDAVMPPAATSGVVRGRVTTTDGRALSRAQVRLLAGGALPRAVYTGTDGRFEFRELPARAFRVMASKVGYSAALSGGPSNDSFDLAEGETREGLDLTLSRWGAIAGRVFDELGDPLEGASVQVLQVRYQAGRRRLVPAASSMRLTDDLGRYRLFALAPGQYVVSAAVGGVASTELPGYARSYFPGTPNPGDAQFVSVGLSQEVDGVDLSLSRTRTVRVAGKTRDSAGAPTTAGSLMLMPSQRSAAVTSVAVGARILADGRFEFPNVTPGQYVIQASRGRSQSSAEGEFGSLAVSVADTDVADLVLQTMAGSSITGRFTFESDDPSKQPSPSGVALSPIPIDFDLSPANNWASADIHDDWTFEMTGITGPRRLQLLSAPSGWSLKEILVNRIDVTDRPLSFGRKEQSLTDVEVVLTNRVNEVAGAVTRSGKRASGATVIVFSSDRDDWYFTSRFVRKATAHPDGDFTLTGLPFGSYYAAAVAALPADGDDGWQDPAFLESLISRASSVRLADGQKVSVTLTY